VNIMKEKSAAPFLIAGINLVAVALVAATTFFAAPAFASGYGPAPGYNPLAGAPSSQRGPSALASDTQLRQAAATGDAYGGMSDTRSVAGTQALSAETKATFAHR
jgi:hypothetical protein